MILESIYEGSFSRHSHGFRPKHSCHTALMEVKRKFIGTRWFIEGDIKGCFDHVDHAVLINLLRRRIKDEYFISLIWKFLKAGYLENWVYHNTYSGTPQGSIISPILANIYLHELDCFMEQLSEDFRRGKLRKRTKEYQKYVGRMQYLRDHKYSQAKWEKFSPEEKQAATAEMKETRKKMMSVPASDPMDENFRRLVYVRYADDFLIGVIGSQQDAKDIKENVGVFLKESLKLEMSDEKTLITHAKKEKAHFLGYEIFICDDQTPKKGSRGKTQRVMNGQVMLYVPKEKWMSKLFSYEAMKITYDAVSGKEIWKSTQRKKLLHLDDLEILRQYNAEIRGLYNYYKIANNATVLNAFGYMMKYSMYKTFASKYRTKVKKVKKKYRVGKDFGVRYETKTGTKTALFYNEGFRRQTEMATGEFDQVFNSYFRDSPCSLIERLKAQKCEWCGAENTDLEVHHVRRLRDLKGKALWEWTMIGRKRKTMVLCVACHDLLHAGKLD